MKISKVGTGGTGCPQGTVSTIISDDRSVVTLIYDSYVASIGPGIAVTEQRKNCQLTLELEYPGGFQYSILSADYRGYANIEKGITGTLKSTYYFAGKAPQVYPILPHAYYCTDIAHRPARNILSTDQ